MQNITQYQPCPNCGQNNAIKISFTWWGGAVGPSIFNHVKCQNCNTQYNGKTGESNTQRIIIYFIVSSLIVLCLCGGMLAFYTILQNQ